jgi:hypothetical protein
VQFFHSGLDTSRVPVNDFSGYGPVSAYERGGTVTRWLRPWTSERVAAGPATPLRSLWVRLGNIARVPTTPCRPLVIPLPPTAQMLSTVVFNWGYLTTVPSWLNEKSPNVRPAPRFE